MKQKTHDSIFVRVMVSIWSRRRFLSLAALVMLGVSATVAWLVPKAYTSSCSIQVKSKEKSGLPSQLKGLKMLDPLSGDNNGISTVLAIFDSRELAVKMIERFGLMRKYRTKWMHLAVKRFQKNLNVDTYGEGIIKVDFTDPSQDSVKLMLDSILAYVDGKNRELATSKARMDFQFMQGQVDGIYADLNRISDSTITLLRKYNMADFSSQMEIGLGQLANIDQELTKLSSEEKSMLTDNSSPIIKIKQVQTMIAYLKQKQSQLLKGKPVSVSKSSFNFIPPYDTIPTLAKQFKFLEGEVKKNEGFLMMLLPRLQDTRIAMVENTPTISFIDPSFRPDYKSKPKRILIILIIMVPGMFLLMAGMVFWDFLSRPDYASDSGREILRYVRAKSG
jgi:capsule polysaccharide export protein KpsE/RkpR